jgi:hypothetical protein
MSLEIPAALIRVHISYISLLEIIIFDLNIA